MPITVDQACLYATHLAERLKYLPIVTYYQAVVFYHACGGIEPVRRSNQILQATLKGHRKEYWHGAECQGPHFPSPFKSHRPGGEFSK